MAAPIGNRFWEARSKSGRNPIFDNPEQLWESCVEYFNWVEENPLYEQKAFSYQGEIVKTDLYKMRAMTIGGLCIFLDICKNTWTNLKNQEDFLSITSKVEEIIKSQKFTGAAADLLNANIIARDLGLTDKKEIGSDPDRPVVVIAADMTADEATAAYRSILDD